MAEKEYIDREAAIYEFKTIGNIFVYGRELCEAIISTIASVPAADVRPVVTCADCKHNNACLTQAFVEDASRVPFDRNTFFCADGKRADDA